MLKSATIQNGDTTRRWLRVGCLIVLLCFVLPTTAWAGPATQGPEECAQCHPAEATVWQHSPHAQATTVIDENLESFCSEADSEDCDCLSCHTTGFNPDDGTYDHAGVTCEACHGAYVADHPQSGAMHLDVNSSPCQDCHTTTYQEWETTFHAQSGVQCIGCHQSHTQETRQAGDALCGSCHRERLQDFQHTAHENADVTCTDCHLSASAHGETAEVRLVGGGTAPNHNFTVSSWTCAGCHEQSIHVETPGTAADQAYNVRLTTMTERARELAYEVEDVKKDNRSLQTVAVISLGLGLGIGGVLGVIFVSVIGFLGQGRSKS